MIAAVKTVNALLSLYHPQAVPLELDQSIGFWVFTLGLK